MAAARSVVALLSAADIRDVEELFLPTQASPCASSSSGRQQQHSLRSADADREGKASGADVRTFSPSSILSYDAYAEYEDEEGGEEEDRTYDEIVEDAQMASEDSCGLMGNCYDRSEIRQRSYARSLHALEHNSATEMELSSTREFLTTDTAIQDGDLMSELCLRLADLRDDAAALDRQLDDLMGPRQSASQLIATELQKPRCRSNNNVEGDACGHVHELKRMIHRFRSHLPFTIPQSAMEGMHPACASTSLPKWKAHVEHEEQVTALYKHELEQSEAHQEILLFEAREARGATEELFALLEANERRTMSLEADLETSRVSDDAFEEKLESLTSELQVLRQRRLTEVVDMEQDLEGKMESDLQTLSSGVSRLRELHGQELFRFESMSTQSSLAETDAKRLQLEMQFKLGLQLRTETQELASELASLQDVWEERLAELDSREAGTAFCSEGHASDHNLCKRRSIQSCPAGACLPRTVSVFNELLALREVQDKHHSELMILAAETHGGSQAEIHVELHEQMQKQRELALCLHRSYEAQIALPLHRQSGSNALTTDADMPGPSCQSPVQDTDADGKTWERPAILEEMEEQRILASHLHQHAADLVLQMSGRLEQQQQRTDVLEVFAQTMTRDLAKERRRTEDVRQEALAKEEENELQSCRTMQNSERRMAQEMELQALQAEAERRQMVSLTSELRHQLREQNQLMCQLELQVRQSEYTAEMEESRSIREIGNLQEKLQSSVRQYSHVESSLVSELEKVEGLTVECQNLQHQASESCHEANFLAIELDKARASRCTAAAEAQKLEGRFKEEACCLGQARDAHDECRQEADLCEAKLAVLRERLQEQEQLSSQGVMLQSMEVPGLFVSPLPNDGPVSSENPVERLSAEIAELRTDHDRVKSELFSTQVHAENIIAYNERVRSEFEAKHFGSAAELDALVETHMVDQEASAREIAVLLDELSEECARAEYEEHCEQALALDVNTTAAEFVEFRELQEAQSAECELIVERMGSGLENQETQWRGELEEQRRYAASLQAGFEARTLELTTHLNTELDEHRQHAQRLEVWVGSLTRELATERQRYEELCKQAAERELKIQDAAQRSEQQRVDSVTAEAHMEMQRAVSESEDLQRLLNEHHLFAMQMQGHVEAHASHLSGELCRKLDLQQERTAHLEGEYEALASELSVAREFSAVASELSVAREFSEVENFTAELTSRMESQQERMEDLEDEFVSLVAEVASARRSTEEAKQCGRIHECRHAANQQVMQEQREEMQEQREEIERMQNELCNLVGEITTTPADLHDSLQRQQQRTACLEVQLSSLVGDLAGARQLLQEHPGPNNETEMNMALDAECQMYAEELRVSRNLRELSERNAHFEVRLQLNVELANDLRRQLEEQSRRAVDLEATVASLECQLAIERERSDAEHLLSARRSIEQHVRALRDLEQTLEAERQHAAQQEGAHRKEVEEASAIADKLREQLEAQRRRNDQLVSEIAQHQGTAPAKLQEEWQEKCRSEVEPEAKWGSQLRSPERVVSFNSLHVQDKRTNGVTHAIAKELEWTRERSSKSTFWQSMLSRSPPRPCGKDKPDAHVIGYRERMILWAWWSTCCVALFYSLPPVTSKKRCDNLLTDNPCADRAHYAIAIDTALKLYACCCAGRQRSQFGQMLLRLVMAAFRLNSCDSLARNAERARLRGAHLAQISIWLGTHMEHVLHFEMLLVLQKWRLCTVELQRGASTANTRGLARCLASLSTVLAATAVSELFFAWAGIVVSRAFARASIPGRLAPPTIAVADVGVRRLAAVRLVWQQWLHSVRLKRIRRLYLKACCSRDARCIGRCYLTAWHNASRYSAICRKYATNSTEWHAIGTHPCAEAAFLLRALDGMAEQLAALGRRAFEERQDVSHGSRLRGAAALLTQREHLDICCSCFLQWRSIAWVGAAEGAAIALARRAEESCTQELSEVVGRRHGTITRHLMVLLLRCDRQAICQLCMKQWWAATQLETMELRLMSVISERRADSKRQFSEAARLGNEVTAMCQQLEAADRKIMQSAVRSTLTVTRDFQIGSTAHQQTRRESFERGISTSGYDVSIAFSRLRQFEAWRTCLMAWHYVSKLSASRSRHSELIIDLCVDADRKSEEVCRLRGKASLMIDQLVALRTQYEQRFSSMLQASELHAQDQLNECHLRYHDEVATVAMKQQTKSDQLYAEMVRMHHEQLASIVASRDKLSKELAVKVSENTTSKAKVVSVFERLEKMSAATRLQDILMAWFVHAMIVVSAGKNLQIAQVDTAQSGPCPPPLDLWVRLCLYTWHLAITSRSLSFDFIVNAEAMRADRSLCQAFHHWHSSCTEANLVRRSIDRDKSLLPIAVTIYGARWRVRLNRNIFIAWESLRRGTAMHSGRRGVPDFRWVDPREAQLEVAVDSQAPRVYRAVFLPSLHRQLASKEDARTQAPRELVDQSMVGSSLPGAASAAGLSYLHS